MEKSPPAPATAPKTRRSRWRRQLRRTRQLFSLLWPYARPHKLLLAGGFGFSIAVIIFRAAQPWPIKWIVDGLTNHPLRLPWFPGSTEIALVPMGLLAGLYVVVSLLASLAEYGQLMTLAGLGNRVLFAFRAALYKHVLRQPLSFHEKRATGELLTRVVYDTARMRRGVNGVLTRIFQTILSFIVILGVLFWLDTDLASIVALTGLVALATMGSSNRRIFKASRKQRKREGQLAGTVAEKLLGIRELQTFRPGGFADDHFERHNTKSLKQEQKVRRLAALLLVRVELLLALCITLILWLGSAQVQAGQLTAGDLILFVSYVLSLYRPFSQFSRQTARSGKTFASSERLARIMRRKPAVSDSPDAVEAPAFRGDIALETASVKNRNRLHATRKWGLADISFRVQAGERIGVLGHNGSGKSTLLRLILRLMDPSDGQVLVDGRNLKEYTLDSLRRQISVVFQDSVFFGLSIRENIAFGRADAKHSEVEEAARRSRIHDLIEGLPKGYDTVISQRGQLFSVGERQRIAIARALLHDGRIWLLDEPTAGLDLETSQELMAFLFEVTRGRTLLCVTHDDQILSSFDRVIVLNDGKIDFIGTPSEYRAKHPSGKTTGPSNPRSDHG